MQRAKYDDLMIKRLPEEEIVEQLQHQKEQLERHREIEMRKAAAISQAKNLRDDIRKLGGEPIK